MLPIAFRLLSHEDSAVGTRTYLKRVWKRGLGWGYEGQILAALAEAGDNEASVALDTIAYKQPHHGDGSVVSAIRALVKVSPDEAFAAAERFYQRSRAESAAYLLLELNAEGATDILLGDHAAAPVPVRHQNGRLLRRAAPRRLLVETITRLSESIDISDRLMAAELAGWMPIEEPIEFLGRLAQDQSEVVEKAALVALRQRQADGETAELIAALPDQPRPRQWAWLCALVRRGDPAHLADPKDPRSIHALLDHLGDDFREEANSLLKKRSKELATAAEKLEKSRRG
jgi:HEAT repeat protein